MTEPLIPPDTSNLNPTLARHWAVRVRLSESDPWTWVLGLSGVDPTVSKTRQEAGDYHGGPYGGQIATEAAWTLALTLMRKIIDGEPDPGVELLRSRDGLVGQEEFVYVQWWRTDELPDSYEGRGGVEFTNTGGDKTALQGATVTITGFQQRRAISKPKEVEAATGIFLSPVSASLEAGDTLQMTVEDNNDVNRTGDVTYASATPSKATVSSKGRITAVAAGTSVITASLGSLTDTATITITD